ncbi:hypothetical protein [Bradyrhizobium brasilense]|uniref:Uncharacterized protein n=1 Tax=Bradyrhizobium brasilense TaxID=1419277 RepID=A0ABY8JAL2_9BRAD|nr:hypothetical protein [Bradyrhizobium brasilense]WFU62602.1 hypothetical protein QA636_34900 [Bradyrhizobium brasilense]
MHVDQNNVQVPGSGTVEPRRATEKALTENAWVGDPLGDPAESMRFLIDFVR